MRGHRALSLETIMEEEQYIQNIEDMINDIGEILNGESIYVIVCALAMCLGKAGIHCGVDRDALIKDVVRIIMAEYVDALPDPDSTIH
jgi:hypothetical protein